MSKYDVSSNLLYSGVRSALEKNNVSFIDININKERNEPSPYWISIPTLKPYPSKPVDKKIINKIVTFQPDLILLLQYSGLLFLFANGISIRKFLPDTKIAFWFVDLAEKIFENKKLGALIDFMFLSNEKQLLEYQNLWGIKKIYFMPQGAFTTNHINNNNPTCPIGFLGRRQRQDPRYRERNKILDEFKNKFGLEEPEEEIANIAEIINFYQKCKIILGVSYHNDVDLYSSDRLFNVLGAGGFYLCSYFPKIDKLFTNHRHIVWFKNIKEGFELVQYYLKHDQERKKIAQEGYELVCRKHTYSHRINNILEIIDGKIRSFHGFL